MDTIYERIVMLLNEVSVSDERGRVVPPGLTMLEIAKDNDGLLLMRGLPKRR